MRTPGGPVVVVAEDDPAFREAVGAALRDGLGLEPVLVEDGERLVAVAGELRPDVVVADVWMPKLDGLQATMRLRAEPGTAAVPVVAVSDEGNRELAVAAGCSAFLAKPFRLADLVALVRGYLPADGGPGG